MNDNERETRLQLMWEELNGGFALSNQDGRFLYEQLEQRGKMIADLNRKVDRVRNSHLYLEQQNALMLSALESALFDIETGNARVAKSVIRTAVDHVKALPVSRQGETSDSVAASEPR